MKKQVMNYISKLGGSSAYSGNTRTLFINDPTKDNEWKETIESAVLRKYGFGLPFKLKTN